MKTINAIDFAGFVFKFCQDQDQYMVLTAQVLNFETKSLRPRVRVSLNPSVVACSNVISFPNTLVTVWPLKVSHSGHCVCVWL